MAKCKRNSRQQNQTQIDAPWDIERREDRAAKREPLRPLTERQADYMDALLNNIGVISLGVPGTGKTFIPAAMAADMFAEKQIAKIVLTRPNVSAGPQLGHRPGTLEEKLAEWFAEILGVIKKRMGAGAFEYAMKHKEIEMVPLESMRGRTFADEGGCFVIMDEAQNTTPEQMLMFLTRIGELGDNGRVVINGDIAQSDLRGASGLKVALDVNERQGLGVPVIEFGIEDIVRSGWCRMWLEGWIRHKAA